MPGVGAHVRPDGAAKAAQIRVGHNDKVGQAGSESGERRPLDQRSLPVSDPQSALPGIELTGPDGAHAQDRWMLREDAVEDVKVKPPR